MKTRLFMEEQIKLDIRQLMLQLVRLQKDMDYVREHIEDAILTEDDWLSIESAEVDYKNEKTVSSEKLKKELGI